MNKLLEIEKNLSLDKPTKNKILTREEMDWLIARVKRLEEALGKCCAPEPDGFGGFVHERFESDAVKEGRKVLNDS